MLKTPTFILIYFFCCCPSLGSLCRALQPPTAGEDPAAEGEETPPRSPHPASPVTCRLPAKQMHRWELGNTPKTSTKCPNPSPCSPKTPASPCGQEVAGGAFPLGGCFPCNPSKDYAALMSSSPGGAYFLAELISCCEEITGQCFPRTCGNGRGMVSQQGYLLGETEARSSGHVPESPSGRKAQRGSRDLKIPQGLVKRCCLVRIGGENKSPPSPGHWVCWYALGSSAVPS